jgi:hypothetical protein
MGVVCPFDQDGLLEAHQNRLPDGIEHRAIV